LLKSLSLLIKGILTITLIWLRATKELLYILKWKITEMKTKDQKKKEIAKRILKVAGKEFLTHIIIKVFISLGVPSFVIMAVKIIFEVFG